jgi:hypothetical protein
VLVHYFASNAGYAIRADGSVMGWGIFKGGKPGYILSPTPLFKVKLAD